MVPRWTLKHTLIGVASVGAAVTVLVGGIGWIATERLGDAVGDMAVAATGVRTQMAVARSHEALRADVLGAWYAADHAPADKPAILAAMTGDAGALRDAVRALDHLELGAEVDRARSEIQAGVNGSIGSAEEMSRAAFQNRAAGDGRFAEFERTFADQRGKIAALGQALVARNAAVAAAGARAGTRLNAIVLAALLIGAGVVFVLGWRVSGPIVDDVTRARQMVDAAPINIIYCDRDLVIRYVNQSTVTTLRGVEAHLALKADRLLGQSIEAFHQGGAQQLLADPRNLPYSAQIKLGPEDAELNASAITGPNGDFLGTMLTWEITTTRLETERQIREARSRETAAAAELRSKVDQILAVVNAATAGDLTRSITVNGDDAIGRLGGGLDRFLNDLGRSLGEIRLAGTELRGSSGQLTATSQTMSSAAEETSAQASVVSAAADEVSRSVQTVATGTEQMMDSIREISRNANEAARVASEAVAVVESTDKTVSKLGASSAEIGDVIKVITAIAQQTNLLALNATIEAGRAGEAGKGFAVVATEVKELARETAKATSDISRRIEAIQHDTTSAVDAIHEIRAIVQRINEIQVSIASAVEEQTATTNEMGRSLGEAARGAAEIAQNITGVAEAAQETTRGATDALHAGELVARLAIQLENQVARFKIAGELQEPVRPAALGRREAAGAR